MTDYMPTKEVNTLRSDKELLSLWFIKPLDLVMIKGWAINTPDLKYRFESLIEKIQQHLDSRDNLRVFLDFELCDAVTTRFIFRIVRMFNEKSGARNAKLEFNWMVGSSDSDMFDSAADFKSLSNFTFNIVEK